MSTVKFIHSGMAGAPVLSGTAGALIAVLDAALVNGFGSATVDSLVVAGGVATVTRAAGHPFVATEVAQIGGATVAGGSVNGDKVVLSATATQYTFDATGIPNQTATGTVTHKVAPLGWQKTFAGTNLAAYKSLNVLATGCLLRVDDTATGNGRAVGYLTMADINTGTGPFPTAAQVASGLWWPKSNVVSAAARGWMIVGDDRGFYLATDHTGGNIGSTTVAFGDFQSLKSPDPYGCILNGMTSDIVSATPGTSTSDVSYRIGGGMYFARGVSGLGGPVLVTRNPGHPLGSVSGAYSGSASASFMAFPNPADNGLFVLPMTVGETSPVNCYRGVLPGFWFVPQAVAATFTSRDIVTGVTGLTGRSLRAIRNGEGTSFYDVTGPWVR
jgi:hypothetical protein